LRLSSQPLRVGQFYVGEFATARARLHFARRPDARIEWITIARGTDQNWLRLADRFLTGHGDIPMSVRAIKAGAEDFLVKPAPKKMLVEVIERALKRYDETHELNVRLNTFRELLTTLTQREREVFALVVRGKLNKQIAHDLGTSERTIKAHRHSIMEKFKIRSLAELVSIAERLGILAET
jgi:RNA polymerase sigma factor (sigma-70 family)